MKKKFIFVLALILLMTATAVTFAQTTATASVNINAGGTSGNAATIKTLANVGGSIQLKYSTGTGAPYTHVAPEWVPIVEHAGAVTAGDIYYVDAGDYTGDILVTINLTNPEELSLDYSYLNLNVNVWEGSSGDWSQAAEADGSAIGTVYLTLINGSTTFILHGATEYCISLDGGSYYCINTNATGGSLSPDFYLDVSPI
jgi:hypothetical protein